MSLASQIWQNALEINETYRANLEAQEASNRAYHEEFIEGQMPAIVVTEPAQWEKDALAEIDEFVMRPLTKGGEKIGEPTR